MHVCICIVWCTFLCKIKFRVALSGCKKFVTWTQYVRSTTLTIPLRPPSTPLSPGMLAFLGLLGAVIMFVHCTINYGRYQSERKWPGDRVLWCASGSRRKLSNPNAGFAHHRELGNVIHSYSGCSSSLGSHARSSEG